MPETHILQPERIQKYLASLGVGSRRHIESLISSGQIKVNNQKAKLGQKVSLDDKISISGKIFVSESPKIETYIFNKPAGIISTVSDEHHRKSVVDYFPRDKRLYPVGRLDKDTSGLIVVTNDGDLAYRLTHPKFEIEKEYLVTVSKSLTPGQLARIIRGIHFASDTLKADKVLPVGERSYKIILHEGKNREIRKMMSACRVEVIKLKRIRIGKLGLGELKEGNYRLATTEDIKQLI